MKAWLWALWETPWLPLSPGTSHLSKFWLWRLKLWGRHRRHQEGALSHEKSLRNEHCFLKEGACAHTERFSPRAKSRGIQQTQAQGTGPGAPREPSQRERSVQPPEVWSTDRSEGRWGDKRKFPKGLAQEVGCGMPVFTGMGRGGRHARRVRL